eukprot:1221648-Pyramimonas_sp.AAC.1
MPSACGFTGLAAGVSLARRGLFLRGLFERATRLSSLTAYAAGASRGPMIASSSISRKRIAWARRRF